MHTKISSRGRWVTGYWSYYSRKRARSGPSQADLAYQAIVNQSQPLPTLLSGIRHLLDRQQQPGNNNFNFRAPPNQIEQARQPKDLSAIKCFTCGLYGHYASAHNTEPPKAITANTATSNGQRQSSTNNSQTAAANSYYPHPVACLLPVSNLPQPSLAAQKVGESNKHARTQRPQRILKKPDKSVPVEIPQADERYEGTHDPIEVDEPDGEEIEELASPSTLPLASTPNAAGKMPMTAARSNQNPPQTRISKTGKVQELINATPPKIPDSIRAMVGKKRFDISTVFEMPVNLTLGQLCDSSDTMRHELAYGIMRSTPRYRIRKATKQQAPTAASASMAIVASVQNEPPAITTQALEDDGKSQPLMITSWIGAVKIVNTLIDGGSIVELVNRLKLLKMSPPPPIHTDGFLRVSLATEVVSTLTNYVFLPVNVIGVQAIVKAWICENQVYDLLLGIPWMRRVACVPDYGTGQVTIRGADKLLRQVPAEIAPILELPTVELDEADQEDGGADALCQLLLDEQENCYP